jgi:hypothetical protein
MSRKQPNPKPPHIKHKPPPPPPPPRRTFKDFGILGSYETKESKQATRDWQNYIRGFGEGLKVGRHSGHK